MDIKVGQVQQTQQVQQTDAAQIVDDQFKFTLASKLEDTTLADRLTTMMQDIQQQGKLIGKKHDIRDMQRYRKLIKEFLNEVITRSHAFSRENFLDRKGRHRVYGNPEARLCGMRHPGQQPRARLWGSGLQGYEGRAGEGGSLLVRHGRSGHLAE